MKLPGKKIGTLEIKTEDRIGLIAGYLTVAGTILFLALIGGQTFYEYVWLQGAERTAYQQRERSYDALTVKFVKRWRHSTIAWICVQKESP